MKNTFHLPCCTCWASPSDDTKICLQVQETPSGLLDDVIFVSGGGKLPNLAACSL